MSRDAALWIGGLEAYTDEAFLRRALLSLGEDDVISIKIFPGKDDASRYGFINFRDEHSALLALHKLNGKVIPETKPPLKFRLNHNSNRSNERENSVWVGDLTHTVDDLSLFTFFSSRFSSVKSAKVIVDHHGLSKGFGFVKFSKESDMHAALASMSNAMGLGEKPIKVRSVELRAKNKDDSPSSTNPDQSYAKPTIQESSYSSYYQAYQSYAGYPQAAYAQYYDQSMYTGMEGGYQDQYAAVDNTYYEDYPRWHDGPKTVRGLLAQVEYGPVAHNLPVDYESANLAFMETSDELWEAIENSRWCEEFEI